MADSRSLAGRSLKARGENGEDSERVFLGLTMAQTWAILLTALVIALLLGSQVGFVDLGYHLRAGELMVEQGHWLDRDVFTSTFSGSPWLNQNWLAQLALYGMWEFGGLTGLTVLNALLFGSGFAILLRICTRRSGNVRTAAMASIATLLPAIFNTSIRPQSFSWLLMAVVLLVLESSQERPRLLLALPLLFALWANLHGAFAVGLGFLALETVSAALDARKGRVAPRRSRQLLIASAVSGIAVLINPWGWSVYRYVLDIGGDPTIRNSIQEWQPPALNDVAGALFFASVAIVVGGLALSRERLGPRDLLRITFGAGLGLLAIRNGLWWTFAAAPALSSVLAPVSKKLDSSGDRPSFMNGVFAVAALCLVLLVSPWLRSSSPLIPDRFRSPITNDTPIGAARFLSEHELDGNMLNTQAYGSFLEFTVPEHKTFVDSRIEMFPDGLWRKYTTLMSADPGWRAIVDERDIGFAVLARKPHVPLAEALASADWERVFRDADSVIFVRSDE
jgi:hypothetical protein